MIPIMPLLARDFGASPLQVGVLMSIYSLMQFLFAPFWGQLSDRYGRRVIIILCLFGEALAYLLFALARDLEWLFMARTMAGFFGASISTASAYISDVTPRNERSRGMALIGAAFGLGFIIGPALGGGLAALAEGISSAPFFGTSFVALSVSVLCLCNARFAYFFLRESNRFAGQSLSQRAPRMTALVGYLRRPVVSPLILVYFLSVMGMALMEATLILFVGERFQWGIKEVSFGFAFVGLVSAFSQGFLVRMLIPKLGERRILLIGLVLLSLGLSGIAISKEVSILTVMMILLALGNSFVNPSTLGSLSLLGHGDEQGALMGSAQSMAALGRIVGPALGGWSFQFVSHESPFLLAGAVVFMGLLLVSRNFLKLPESGRI